MNAGEIMQKPVLATTVRASVRDIAVQLVGNGISGMPVVEPDGKVLGVITEADLVKSVVAGKPLEALTAKDIMSKDPITVDVKTPVQELAKVLVDKGIVRVPVTEHGKLVGIVSRSDVIRSILEPEFLTF